MKINYFSNFQTVLFVGGQCSGQKPSQRSKKVQKKKIKQNDKGLYIFISLM